MTAYTAGWNAHLAEAGADGLDDWCDGADWVRPLEPVEVYAYGRSIALNASAVPRRRPGRSRRARPGLERTRRSPLLPVAVRHGRAGAASNGWAIGAERSAGGRGMLVANPHFPWEGQLRFWEVHLTVPGEIDMYGVQLSGLPGLAIGFTEDFGWTHTVSAGNRFTAYRSTWSRFTHLVPLRRRAALHDTGEDSIEVLGEDDELSR